MTLRSLNRRTGRRQRGRPEAALGFMGVRKPIIGLAGGIGSGKSTVARILAELGAAVIDADELNRQVLVAQETRDILVSWWGRRILAADGSVDRAAIADLVFRDPMERARLESLVHPLIAERRERLLEQYQDNPQVRAIVIDAPLLFEAGLVERCDRVVFVETDRGVRTARVASDRGWSGEELARREKSQLPLDLKRRRADHVCRNNSDMAVLRQQVEALFSQVVSGTPLDE